LLLNLPTFIKVDSDYYSSIEDTFITFKTGNLYWRKSPFPSDSSIVRLPLSIGISLKRQRETGLLNEASETFFAQKICLFHVFWSQKNFSFFGRTRFRVVTFFQESIFSPRRFSFVLITLTKLFAMIFVLQ